MLDLSESERECIREKLRSLGLAEAAEIAKGLRRGTPHEGV
jgi:hypothetical protein